MRHKRFPERYRSAPDNANDKSDGEISESVFADVVFAFRRFLLDELTELKDRKQQPAPDEIVGDPVSPLFADDVHHARDHEHIRDVADKRFQSGDAADLQEILHPTEVELLFGKSPDPLFVQKNERNGKKQDVNDYIGVADAVDAEVGRYGQRRYKEGVENDRQNQPGTGKNIDVPASVYGDKRNKRELREYREDVGDALYAYICCGRFDNTFVGGHQPEQLLGEDENHRRQNGIHSEGHKHSRAHAVGERLFVLFYFPDEEEQRENDRLADDFVQQVYPGKLAGYRERPVARQLSKEEHSQRGINRRAETEDEKREE